MSGKAILAWFSLESCFPIAMVRNEPIEALH
jgi:hypothetical protein